MTFCSLHWGERRVSLSLPPSFFLSVSSLSLSSFTSYHSIFLPQLLLSLSVCPSPKPIQLLTHVFSSPPPSLSPKLPRHSYNFFFFFFISQFPKHFYSYRLPLSLSPSLPLSLSLSFCSLRPSITISINTRTRLHTIGSLQPPVASRAPEFSSSNQILLLHSLYLPSTPPNLTLYLSSSPSPSIPFYLPSFTFFRLLLLHTTLYTPYSTVLRVFLPLPPPPSTPGRRNTAEGT